ncbi:phage neck terminator protein [Pragia fontium]|uniref:phage neck terminator protein n=1 Tax=Pragia fontium TaxID=82985 RepID=UPI000F831E80|nr:hypothetical protein [Pragia fontium]
MPLAIFIVRGQILPISLVIRVINMPTETLSIYSVKDILKSLLRLTDEQITASFQPNLTSPLAALALLEVAPLGGAKLEFLHHDEIERVTVDCSSTIRLTTYGEQAYELMMRAYCVIHSSQGKSEFKRKHLSLLKTSPIRQQNEGSIPEQSVSMELILTHKINVDVEQRRMDACGLVVHTETNNLK